VKPTLLMLALNTAGLLYMFLALAIVCDEHGGGLRALARRHHREAQPLARRRRGHLHGRGRIGPGVLHGPGDVLQGSASDVGVATIVGSAVFNVLFVIGACGIAAKSTLQLTAFPLARDSMFYTVHLIFFYYIYPGATDL
ncbi:unnamed protein product, partial [Prorocentrum cordatum]